MKRAGYIVAVAGLCAAIGCEGNVTTAPETAAVDATAAAAPAAPTPSPPGDPSQPAPAQAAPQATPAAPPGQVPTPAEVKAMLERPANAPQPTPEGGATEVAKVGVGAKGRDYGGPGFITTPIQEYFRTGDRIAFEIQIPNAMKLYKAEHDNKGPKTHDEFMNIIVKENGVQLPELPPGDEYVYDPKTEQLLVKHPTGSQPQ
jgi:hypothetical protein